MRNSWAGRTLAPIACALILAGCNEAGRDRQTRDQAATKEPPAAATVALSGCLEAAPGTNRYVLRNVRFEPRAGGDPHASTTTPGGHGITEGAWVRVDPGEQDLKSFLGQRVVLKGAVTDDGRNTIGTAGTPGIDPPNRDTSQAASPGHYAEKQKKEMGRIARESMADGTAAQVRATEVSGTGERCEPPKPVGR